MFSHMYSVVDIGKPKSVQPLPQPVQPPQQPEANNPSKVYAYCFYEAKLSVAGILFSTQFCELKKLEHQRVWLRQNRQSIFAIPDKGHQARSTYQSPVDWQRRGLSLLLDQEL